MCVCGPCESPQLSVDAEHEKYEKAFSGPGCPSESSLEVGCLHQ